MGFALASNQGVGGSNPSGRTNNNNGLRFLTVGHFSDRRNNRRNKMFLGKSQIVKRVGFFGRTSLRAITQAKRIPARPVRCGCICGNACLSGKALNYFRLLSSLRNRGVRSWLLLAVFSATFGWSKPMVILPSAYEALTLPHVLPSDQSTLSAEPFSQSNLIILNASPCSARNQT